MSEQTVDQPMVEETDVQETEQPTGPYIPEGSPFAPVFEATSALLIDTTTQANNLVAQFKSIDNREATILDVIETSEDAAIAGFRAYRDEHLALIEDAFNKINQYVRENVLPKSEEDVDPEKLTADYKALVEQIKGFRTALQNLPEGDKVLESLPTLESMGRRGGGGGNQTGKSRPRLAAVKLWPVGDESKVTEVFEKVEDKKNPGTFTNKVSYTILAQWLKKHFKAEIDPSMLHEHATAGLSEALGREVKGGSEDYKALEGKPFTFVLPVQLDADNAINLMVEVTPNA